MDATKTHEAEVAINNIVREIIRECTNKGVKVYRNFVTYYVKLLILDPNCGITLDGLAERNTVHNFVAQCLQKLSYQEHPCIVSLKTQMYFSGNFGSKKEEIDKHKPEMRNKLRSVEKEIINFKYQNPEAELSAPEYANFMRKIVYYCALLSGLGDPTEKEVYEETKCALKSVFFGDDIIYFLLQPEEMKEDTLLALTDLTTGVRLFNKDCQKGGDSIDDLPKIVNQALEISKRDVEETLDYIVSRVNFLTTIIDNAYESIADDEGNDTKTVIVMSFATPEDLEYAKDFLVFYRQYELYTRQILEEVQNVDRKFNTTVEIFRNILKKLHNIVKFKTIVLTSLVYPFFTDLAQTWYEMQGLAIHLANLNKIMYDLGGFEQTTSYDDGRLNYLLGSYTTLSDAERIQTNKEESALDIVTPLVTFIDPNDIEDIDTIKIEFLGFCASKLVETEGGLIPGNINLGIANYDGKYYSFSSRDAAEAFCKDPRDNVNRALHLGRNKPELINFLQIFDQLVAVYDYPTLLKKKIKAREVSLKKIQTDLHPTCVNSGKYFCRNRYYWNVWDWKREAIILANISTKLTHSTQTIKSNGWSSIKVNTHEQRDKIYQTKKDNYTNVPKPSTFIFGLRGRKDDNQHIIKLTRPVDE